MATIEYTSLKEVLVSSQYEGNDKVPAFEKLVEVPTRDSDGDNIHIYIISSSGQKSFEMTFVSKKMRVKELKEAVVCRMGGNYPWYRISLLLKGKELPNGYSLEYCKVEDQAVLVMVRNGDQFSERYNIVERIREQKQKDSSSEEENEPHYQRISSPIFTKLEQKIQHLEGELEKACTRELDLLRELSELKNQKCLAAKNNKDEIYQKSALKCRNHAAVASDTTTLPTRIPTVSYSEDDDSLSSENENHCEPSPEIRKLIFGFKKTVTHNNGNREEKPEEVSSATKTHRQELYRNRDERHLESADDDRDVIDSSSTLREQPPDVLPDVPSLFDKTIETNDLRNKENIKMSIPVRRVDLSWPLVGDTGSSIADESQMSHSVIIDHSFRAELGDTVNDNMSVYSYLWKESEDDGYDLTIVKQEDEESIVTQQDCETESNNDIVRGVRSAARTRMGTFGTLDSISNIDDLTCKSHDNFDELISRHHRIADIIQSPFMEIEQTYYEINDSGIGVGSTTNNHKKVYPIFQNNSNKENNKHILVREHQQDIFVEPISTTNPPPKKTKSKFFKGSFKNFFRKSRGGNKKYTKAEF